jgi:hypothetical protein
MSISTLGGASAIRASVLPDALPSATAAGSNLASSAEGVPRISQTGDLMSKLGQLSQQDPSHFKSVSSAIAHTLAEASTREQEMRRRSVLETELVHVNDESEAASRVPFTPAPAAEDAGQKLASAFDAAAATGEMSTVAAATSSWTAPALTASLTASIALVSEALGLPMS